jgi:hypothetical protein
MRHGIVGKLSLTPELYQGGCCAKPKDALVLELHHATITDFTKNPSRYVWLSKLFHIILLNPRCL